MTTDRHKTKVRPQGSHLYHNAHTRGIVLFCSGSFSGGSLLSGSLSSGSGSLLSTPEREPQQRERQPSQQPACVNDGS